MNDIYVKEQKISTVLGYLGVAAITFGAAGMLIGACPIANLVKEFGLPAAGASGLLWYLDAGSSAATIVGFLSGLASGGLSLIYAAGRQTIKAYLRREIRKRGRKAVIAW